MRRAIARPFDHPGGLRAPGWRLAIAALLLVAAVVLGSCGAGDPDEEEEPEHAYLVLGDSLGVGVGAEVPEKGGYSAILHRELRSELISVANLAEEGATARSMVRDGQLEAAVATLEAGVDGLPVGLVTLTIGGNDGAMLYEPCSAGLTAECLAEAEMVFDRFDEQFAVILGELIAASGEDARIVVMTYYNPLLHPGCDLNDHHELADDTLEGGRMLGLEAGLNDRIREIATNHDVHVAETYGALAPHHLDDDCLHPNDAGYQIIASQFAQAARE